MLYQCIGISGAILFFYGLLTTALTNIRDDWFVQGLIITGLVGMIVFVIKSLDRVWQKLVLFFVSSNAIWILYIAGQDWSWYWVIVPMVIAAALFVYLHKLRMDASNALVIFIALVLGVLFFQFEQKEVSSSASLIAAIVLNVCAFLVSKRILLDQNQDGAKFTKGTIGFVYALIVFVIVVVLNVLSQDFHYQWDVTANKINTLSEQSVAILNNLEEPLVVHAFYDDANPDKPIVSMLLNMFKNQSSNFSFSVLDPDSEKMMAERFQAKDGDLVIEYQSRSHLTQTLSEEGITQAILKVIKTDHSNLCFTIGHGELLLDGEDQDGRSLSALRNGLDNEGYQYDTIEDLNVEIDPACEIVVIAGPQQSFSQSEAESLDAFLSKGGKAVFLLDPIFSNPDLAKEQIQIQATGLERVLFKWGVELGRNLLLQKMIAMFQGEQIVSEIRGFQYGNHPIVDPFKGRQTVFDGVQSVHSRPDYEGTTYDLIQSFGQGASWTKSNMKELLMDRNANPGPNDLKGPVNFAVATEKEGENATQVVVFGDADFISNELILKNEFNYDLFLNVLGWMTGDEEKISIRPKLFKTSAIELTAGQSKTIFYVAIIFLPMLVLLFGLNLWWIRKQRG